MKRVGVVLVGVLLLAGCSPLSAPASPVAQQPPQESAPASRPASPDAQATASPSPVAAAGGAGTAAGTAGSASAAPQTAGTTSDANSTTGPDWEELSRRAGPMPDAFKEAADGSGVSLEGGVEIKPDNAPASPASDDAETSEQPAPETESSDEAPAETAEESTPEEPTPEEAATEEAAPDEAPSDETSSETTEQDAPESSPAEQPAPDEVEVPTTSASYVDAVVAAWASGDWKRLSELADAESVALLKQAGPGGVGWKRGPETPQEGEGIMFRFERDSDDRVVEVSLHRRAAGLRMPGAASVRFAS